MNMNAYRFVFKPFLALALAVSFLAGTQINQAQAGSSKRAAIIAGAVIGGAIVYHNYRKRKAHKYYHRGHYGKRYYRKKHYGHRVYHRGHYKPYKRHYYRGGHGHISIK